MNRIRKCIFIFFFTFSCTAFFAQDTLRNPFSIGLRPHYGFIFSHSKTIKAISHSNPYGLEMDFNWLLTGQKAWNYCNCFPRHGISFSWFDFGNPDVLGHDFNLSYFVEPFIGYPNSLFGSIRFGGGVNYLTRPYDEETNPKNLFFSSPISFFLFLNAGINYRINDQWNARLAASYNHISNGGMREPNKGINFPTATLGVDYTFGPQPVAKRKKTNKQLIDKEKRRKFTAYAIGKNVRRSEDKSYLVYGLVYETTRVIGRMNTLSLGVEWLSDGSLKEKYIRQGKDLDHHSGSVLIGHELVIGRFIFAQHMGVYIYSPPRDEEFYQRYSLMFHITDRLYTGFSLKSHADIADFMDLRIGISFND
jgi:hypothetical protein